MAPSSPTISLILRVVTFVLVFISLIILTTTSIEVVTTTSLYVVSGTLRFSSYKALRYTLFTMIMGILYTLLQIVFTIYHIQMGKRLAGDGLLQFDFYGDKIISYTLATGTAAAFGIAVDAQQASSGLEDFFSKIYASASLLLFGFLCSAVSSIFSSFSLPKND